jgi:hypothetical protein
MFNRYGKKGPPRPKTQDAEQSDPRDGSLPPLPTLTEYRACRVAGTSILQEGPRENERQKINSPGSFNDFPDVLGAGTSILQEGPRENERQKTNSPGSLNDFFKEAPPFMEKPSFE